LKCGSDAEKVQVTGKDGKVESIGYGTLVWAAPSEARELTKAIGQKAGQREPKGLQVDECLRVKGTRPGEVFALGDCAGRYLGRLFRDGQEAAIVAPETAPFSLAARCTAPFDSANKAIADALPSYFPGGLLALGRCGSANHVWWRSLYGQGGDLRDLGVLGFAAWRSAFLSNAYSLRGRWCVAGDWLRTSLFGRPSAALGPSPSA